VCVCVGVWVTGSTVRSVSVRRFGDAINRWGQNLLASGDFIAAAEVFSSGVEVFESVDGVLCYARSAVSLFWPGCGSVLGLTHAACLWGMLLQTKRTRRC